MLRDDHLILTLAAVEAVPSSRMWVLPADTEDRPLKFGAIHPVTFTHKAVP
jgi:hypothetical protein